VNMVFMSMLIKMRSRKVSNSYDPKSQLMKCFSTNAEEI
jgi:hypothetical protein